MRYRLGDSGDHWDRAGDDRVLEDVRPRYAAFFELILDPERTEELNLLELRDDLEHRPVDRRNYDALNAVAIAYFETNYQGEVRRRDRGMEFMALGFRAAKLLGVPWRAYGLVDDGDLRHAILDFFEDVASARKLKTRRTAPRSTQIVASLRRHESDAERRARIDRIVSRLEALEREWIAEQPASDPLTAAQPPGSPPR